MVTRPAGSDRVPIARLDQSVAITLFKQRIQPLIGDYCYPCHGEGESEGGLKLDGFADHAAMFAVELSDNTQPAGA